jgi:hypothetical protein
VFAAAAGRDMEGMVGVLEYLQRGAIAEPGDERFQ